MSIGASSSQASPGRLAAVYMAYFAIVGTFVPFWSLWLDHRGYSGMQIGVVLGAMAVMRIIAPVVWGWVSDRTGRHDAVMRWGAWGCALLFAAVLIPLDLPALLIAVVAYSIFWNALLPLLERVTLQSLNGDAARYNRVRVWGSLSFIVSVMALGVVFDHLSVAWLPAIVLVQMIVLGACIERLPRARLPGTTGAIKSAWAIVRQPSVGVFLGLCFLAQLAQASYYSFFSLRLETLGISRGVIGQLWAIGVVAEIGVFLFAHTLIQRFSLRALMTFVFTFGVCRWAVIGWWPHIEPLLWMSQLGHAITFGLMHSVSIDVIHRVFPREVAGQGQALYSAVSYGLGGCAGNLLAGALWDTAGAGAPFQSAAVISLMAGLISLVALKTPRVQPT